MNNEGQEYNKLGFPVVVCSKCCGEGKLVKFNHVEAGRCWKCQGTGKELTREGAKAFAAFTAALEAAPKMKASAFKAGDRVQVGKTFGTIASIEDKGRFGILFHFANSRCDFSAAADMELRTDNGVNAADFTKGL